MLRKRNKKIWFCWKSKMWKSWSEQMIVIFFFNEINVFPTFNFINKYNRFCFWENKIQNMLLPIFDWNYPNFIVFLAMTCICIFKKIMFSQKLYINLKNLRVYRQLTVGCRTDKSLSMSDRHDRPVGVGRHDSATSSCRCGYWLRQLNWPTCRCPFLMIDSIIMVYYSLICGMPTRVDGIRGGRGGRHGGFGSGKI